MGKEKYIFFVDFAYQIDCGVDRSYSRMMRNLALIAMLLLAGCDKLATAAKDPFDGYAGLKFGASLNEALALYPPDLFNPVGLRDCLNDLPIRGCFLPPRSGLSTATSRDGIGYAIQLAFNKYDKLTDITLSFQRETSEEESQFMKKEDCAAITERTVDWLATEFGKPDNKQALGDTGKINTTSKGNEFQISDTDGNYFAYGSTELGDDRRVRLLTAYIKLDRDSTSCRIDIEFADADKIERLDCSDTGLR